MWSCCFDIAKQRGLELLTEEKAQICRDYGADDVVIYGSDQKTKKRQKHFRLNLKLKALKVVTTLFMIQ